VRYYITRKEIYIDFVDFQGNKIFLNNYYDKHIREEHGSEMSSFYKYWEETLKYPDFTGTSKRYSECKIYITESNYERNYPAKYLAIVVNEVDLITSVRFATILNFINNIKSYKYENN